MLVQIAFEKKMRPKVPCKIAIQWKKKKLKLGRRLDRLRSLKPEVTTKKVRAPKQTIMNAGSFNLIQSNVHDLDDRELTSGLLIDLLENLVNDCVNQRSARSLEKHVRLMEIVLRRINSGKILIFVFDRLTVLISRIGWKAKEKHLLKRSIDLLSKLSGQFHRYYGPINQFYVTANEYCTVSLIEQNCASRQYERYCSFFRKMWIIVTDEDDIGPSALVLANLIDSIIDPNVLFKEDMNIYPEVLLQLFKTMICRFPYKTTESILISNKNECSLIQSTNSDNVIGVNLAISSFVFKCHQYIERTSVSVEHFSVVGEYVCNIFKSSNEQRINAKRIIRIIDSYIDCGSQLVTIGLSIELLKSLLVYATEKHELSQSRYAAINCAFRLRRSAKFKDLNSTDHEIDSVLIDVLSKTLSQCVPHYGNPNCDSMILLVCNKLMSYCGHNQHSIRLIDVIEQLMLRLLSNLKLRNLSDI
ncbi:hypothetical protein ACOME3_006968 [Neoechinorhynchus agilis]